jgi:DMSO/TMAO reductase YedYZ molybdopterin-dependent catalytic subunit
MTGGVTMAKKCLGTLIFVSVMVCVFAVLGCRKKDISAEAGSVRPLKGVEVRQYHGENLSSVNDFRENSIRGPQHIDIKTYRLRITGLINNRRTYTYSDLINKFQHHRKVIRLDCVEGWSATILWEGLLVRDLLKEAVLSPKAKVVIFHASDGYTTSFPVDYLLNNDIMIAYRMNDVALPPSQGFPFRLVAESKWGYKWIRWITDIEVSDKSGYKGYWESRGYSNSGDLNKSFFDERAQ